jgi:hypothetical protein
MYLDLRSSGIDLTKVVGSEFDGNRAKVLLQPVHFSGAGDGHDPGLLRQQPSTTAAISKFAPGLL